MRHISQLLKGSQFDVVSIIFYSIRGLVFIFVIFVQYVAVAPPVGCTVCVSEQIWVWCMCGVWLACGVWYFSTLVLRSGVVCRSNQRRVNDR